ncbi:MAG TPA: DUF998 domain-containing protein [Thermoplasmata archaeon]|nr:DUF998 domain-containing protein [Thermoplasmata archaeon]
MAGRGPLVPRAAHQGGLVLLLAAIEFTVGMGVTQLGYPGYSDLRNAISDLGNSKLSPWFLVFNLSLILFGILGVVAVWLLRSAFRPKTSSRIGVGLLAVAFGSAVGIGVFPEQVAHSLHVLFSSAAFLASGLALLFLALSMLRDTRWEGLRLYTAASGILILAAIALLFSAATTAADFGAVERLVVAPGLLWAAVAGIHLGRMPVYDPITTAGS